jgi:hypothetical protein
MDVWKLNASLQIIISPKLQNSDIKYLPAFPLEMSIFAFATQTIKKISNSQDQSDFNYEMTNQLLTLLQLEDVYKEGFFILTWLILLAGRL